MSIHFLTNYIDIIDFNVLSRNEHSIRLLNEYLKENEEIFLTKNVSNKELD